MIDLFALGRGAQSVCALAALFGCASLICPAQSLLEGSAPGSAPILRQDVLAAFESTEPLKALSCAVTTQKPVLGLDLKFHAGYQLAIPVQELQPGDSVTLLLRITPKTTPNSQFYFQDRFRITTTKEQANGVAFIPGRVALGSGAYRMELLMHDGASRFCSTSWDITASLGAKDKNVALALEEGAASPVPLDLFLPEPPVQKAEQSPLNIKILANFAPRSKGAAAIDERDTEAMLSILRSISRHPGVGKISLSAFDLYEERIVFKQPNSKQIDFPALGQALKQLKPGTVGLDQLLDKHGSGDFLAGLLQDGSDAKEGTAPDAVIFVGPKAFANAESENLKSIRNLGCPVFYFNYVDDPQAAPWRDDIGKVTKSLGGREFLISGPRDLWNAVSDSVVKLFNVRTSALGAKEGLQ